MIYNIDCRVTGYSTVRVEADSLADAVDKWQKEIDKIDFGLLDGPEIEPIACYLEE